MYPWLYELENPKLKMSHQKRADERPKDNIALISGPRKALIVQKISDDTFSKYGQNTLPLDGCQKEHA